MYQGLRNHFSDTFLKLTNQEHASLMMRTGEFKDLTKKAILLSYMLLNLSVTKIKPMMTTWTFYHNFLKDIEAIHM